MRYEWINFGRSNWCSYAAVRVATGCLLLIAAGLKFDQLGTHAGGPEDVAKSHKLLLLGGSLEAIFAIWILVGWYARATRIVALAMFVVFASYSLSRTVHGAETCGCFGRVSISPAIALAIDLGIIIALAVCRLEGAPAGAKSEARKVAAITAGLLALTGLAFGAGRQFVLFRGDSQDASAVFVADTWIGKQLPLLPHIDIQDELLKGRWRILLHRLSCAKCEQVIEWYSEIESHTDNRSKLALVEIGTTSSDRASPPDWAANNSNIIFGQFAEGSIWLIETPLEIVLLDGKVVATRNFKGLKQRVGASANHLIFSNP